MATLNSYELTAVHAIVSALTKTFDSNDSVTLADSVALIDGNGDTVGYITFDGDVLEYVYSPTN